MKKIMITTISLFSIVTLTTESQGAEGNPLLKANNNPYGVISFDKITPEDMEEGVIKGIELQNKEIKAITDNPETPTFQNTIAAFDRSGTLLMESVLLLSNLEHAMGDTVLMNTYGKVTPLISDHSTSLLLNEKLWSRIKEVHDNADLRKDLTPEQQRLLDETYRSFAESGANLQGEDREKFKKLNSRLSELRVLYAQNVTNDLKNPERRLWIEAKDTVGLPSSFVNAARSAAKEVLIAENGKDDENLFLVTMFMPSYSPFMKYSGNRELRKKLYKMYSSRNYGGEYDNVKILKEIVNLRLELAKLMGKTNFAEYQLQGTMAATPQKVYELLDNLRDNYREPVNKEVAEIEEFARLTEGPDFKLEPWDYSFWSNKLKDSKFSFSEEDLKPYFELNSTIDGVLGLANKLYGYTFKENPEIPVYHPDVKAFEVYEEDGSVLGILYADFYYREGKAPGAWMTDFRTESKDDNGQRLLPLISIVTNFSKPVGDEPVLLTPYEVETFLHEFGHALHGLSSQATYQSLSGTNVYHDFVELFSQFNENFLTEKEFLDSFAKHNETGEPMPEELIQKFIESNQFGAAYSCMRQLGFGYLDMKFHSITEPLKEDEDLTSFENEAYDTVKIFEPLEGTLIAPAFAHIFSGGYAVGYYGYKWAEVLDADAFAEFQETGIFNKDTANKFKKMLQSGGTVDPMELYIEFRGHEPTTDALLKRDGIKK